jgi:hypothetical protein
MISQTADVSLGICSFDTQIIENTAVVSRKLCAMRYSKKRAISILREAVCCLNARDLGLKR